jgi:hypothetical protein
MRLEVRVQMLRAEFLTRGQSPVPDTLQGVTKAHAAEVLGALDLETPDMVDAVFALLDDRLPSWFSAPPPGAKFCDGATVAHLACHVGILQRSGAKLDREGRDYWIKPLRDIGAVDLVILDKKSRTFLPGHPVAKSPNSAHRLGAEFKRILQAPADQWKVLLAEWVRLERIRERLTFQAVLAEETRRKVDTSHVDLINACIEHYAPRFLQGFEVVYVDDSDGERITEEDRERLRDAGLEIDIADAMPDVLLYNRELNELWVIEAVTSDGEVDQQKQRRLVEFTNRNGKDAIGFTTAYPTWKVAARRQAAQKNIAPHTYVWIREDPSRHYRAETFGTEGSTPSTIPSTPS